MKKGNEYEVVITGYEFPNKGIAFVDARKVTVKGAFLGQKVRIRITKAKNGKGEGRLLEVLEKSGDETATPMCTHFGQCGGCTYQTYTYEKQLEIKERQVRDLLDSVCKDNISRNYTWEGIIGSPVVEGYRNKMEFSFGDEYKDGPLALGLHRKGSFYDLVTMEDCKIVDSDYNRIVACTLQHFAERKIPYFKKMSHEGSLRHLVVRQTAKSKDILINLVVSSQVGNGKNEEQELETRANATAAGKSETNCKVVKIAENIEELYAYLGINVWLEQLKALELHGSIAGVLLTVNDSLADVVQSDATYLLYGQDSIYEEILGLKFRITPFSFFQTNSLGAEVLYEKARSYVGDTSNQVVFDLYSGTGTIAQMLAPVAKKVVGVEIVEEAVESAKENAVLNGLDNCEFIAGDVLKVLDDLTELPDMIVLDPPRDGIHPKALNKIIGYGVKRMVYISCKPTSLARDLVTLQAEGYQVEKACCVDMFPWTANIESIVLLSKQENG
ncbi:MAG: 23S rRNA (uracil(1939)-C(5))-methyltransferase RlmD [Lachnospiraceae bacterium]|nr:23S rRNA (uracil(1939)-C(5))-methyltransferase RlmD [Lachnospiraceae bacterium]